ncbi:FliM/FliN family flagellar motor switch protein [Maritimibacter sp. DP1N21-5]|uniref:FliM/FliN family flagellar motor switch protein n=1 Tax=Maritimibacter sp. DP1N21-5 TaxID=2836867 RepID=UPI001C4541BE|nr:FliM/FliN family flagellar motor switch protein [Maritimibacter sp. DP1N21-5]MBV7410341.1 FliM/FliN family flagellar motor switch protein [Maritimibacter sp. DP1N21-5]
MAESMTTDDKPSALRRKAGAGRPPPEIGAPTATKLLRAAIMQAAQDMAGLTVVAGQPSEDRITLEPLVEAVPPHGLMALVEGPAGRYGLVLLDPDVIAALIEVQTTGKVVPKPAAPRTPTRTDAIMCADFIDRMLELLETKATEAGLDIAPTLEGHRYALALPEAGAIPMTLEDIPYRQFRVGVDIAGGAKRGEMQVVLPFDPLPAQMKETGHARSDPPGFARALEGQVNASHAELRATLHRVEMTLAEAMALVEGDLIPVPAEALARVAVEDIHGGLVCHARLGQSEGQRAIRIDIDGLPGTAEVGTASIGVAASKAGPSLVQPRDTQGALPDPLADPGDVPDFGALDDFELPGLDESMDLAALELGQAQENFC